MTFSSKIRRGSLRSQPITLVVKNPSLASGQSWVIPAAFLNLLTVCFTDTAEKPVSLQWVKDGYGRPTVTVNTPADEGVYTAVVKGVRQKLEREVSRRLVNSPYARSGYTKLLSGLHNDTNAYNFTYTGITAKETDRHHVSDFICRVSLDEANGWSDPNNDTGQGLAWNTWTMRTNANQIGQNIIGMSLFPKMGIPGVYPNDATPTVYNYPSRVSQQNDIFQRIINGEFDWVYAQIARNLIAYNQADSIVRIDWEANGGWYEHDTPGMTNVALHGRAVAHAAEKMLDIAPNLKFALDVSSHCGFPDNGAVPGGDGANTAQPMDWLNAYHPQQYAHAGYTVTHLVICDIYFNWDKYIGPTPTYNDFLAMLRPPAYVNCGVTLAYAHDFAVAHNLPLGIGEWGIVPVEQHGGGDTPAYIEHMHRWCSEAPNLAYESYWILNNPDAGDLQTDLDLYPHSKAIYNQLWG